MSSTQSTVADKTWVAFGPAGAVGSVHKFDDKYTFKLLKDDDFRSTYPSLDVAKQALYAALEPGAEWPDFREH